VQDTWETKLLDREVVTMAKKNKDIFTIEVDSKNCGKETKGNPEALRYVAKILMILGSL